MANIEKVEKDKLTIVIPFYKETFNEIAPNIHMINSQVGINFDDICVIFVNDGVDNTEIEIEFNKLVEQGIIKFKAQFYYMDENGGPGVARQTGIDLAYSDYVMFCDADDSLYDIGVLYSIINLINNSETPPDIISTKWIEENINAETKELVYIPHEYDATWMHGNIYRKSFLEYNNIRFRDDLRIHEDSYVQAIAFARTTNIIYHNLTSYIWRHRDESIVRINNSEYTYSGCSEFYRAVGLAYDEILKFNPQALFDMVPQLTFYGYFGFQDSNWDSDEYSKFKESALEEYKNTIGKYLNYYLECPAEKLYEIYKNEFNRVNLRPIPPYTVTQWLLHLELIKLNETEENELEEKDEEDV